MWLPSAYDNFSFGGRGNFARVTSRRADMAMERHLSAFLKPGCVLNIPWYDQDTYALMWRDVRRTAAAFACRHTLPRIATDVT